MIHCREKRKNAKACWIYGVKMSNLSEHDEGRRMIEQLLRIKPLSVNDAWKGRRFKTDEYKAYESALRILFKPGKVPEGELKIFMEFGFSSRGSDGDNPIKPLIDCLEKYYGFNDNRIYEYLIRKCKVKKGTEYVFFRLEGIDEN